MGKFIIEGGRTLTGKISVSGSKNAALPILAACILCRDKCTVKNCPRIKDVENAALLLQKIGAEIKWKGNALTVDSSNINNYNLTDGPADKYRGSIIFLGALLGTFGKAKISAPGGCRIGRRPIDFHIDALSMMNTAFSTTHGIISASAKNLSGEEIVLKFPSVGATENIMIASVLAKGETVIQNAAREPEIVDLQDFLNSMGAKITGAGTSKIISKGVASLHGTEYKIIPDRIEAGTFLIAAAATKGEVFLKNARYDHTRQLCRILEKCGAVIIHDKSGIYINAKKIRLSPHVISTGAYPAFPTDLQPQMMSLLTTAPGLSIIIETVFESRFLHAEELKKLGADITLDENRFTIKGVPYLKAGNVRASDLRCGAALIIAALSAKGTSVVEGSEFVERGYQNIERKLRLAGAAIRLTD